MRLQVRQQVGELRSRKQFPGLVEFDFEHRDPCNRLYVDSLQTD